MSNNCPNIRTNEFDERFPRAGTASFFFSF